MDEMDAVVCVCQRKRRRDRKRFYLGWFIFGTFGLIGFLIKTFNKAYPEGWEKG